MADVLFLVKPQLQHVRGRPRRGAGGGVAQQHKGKHPVSGVLFLDCLLFFLPSPDNLQRGRLDDPAAAVTDIESSPARHRLDDHSLGVTRPESIACRFVPAEARPGVMIHRFTADSFFGMHKF